MTRPRRREPSDVAVRGVNVPELLAELGRVQEAIRVADPRARATEMTTRSPRLLSMFRQERLILRELKRRQSLLRQAVGWTVLAPRGDGDGADGAAEPLQRSARSR